MFISRAIEHNLDREEQDFSLEVTSAGATAPLEHKRQYKKNLGRVLEVKTISNTFEAKITSADENEIALEWKTREPKPVGKVKTALDKIEGKLADVTDKSILLEWKVREPKPVGKGKVTVIKQANIAYEDILEAKVMIKF